MIQDQDMDTAKLLYRARLQLEEGQHEVALSGLQDIKTNDEEQRREIAYLLGWCYIQFKRWDDAINVLSALLPAEAEIHSQEKQAEREKLVRCLLHLGLAAVNLSRYEDASLHFTACLKVLHDRRVHAPLVRIKARYSLGMTCLMRGMYSIAIQHYEEALRLCQHYHDESETANIYHGLCHAYRSLGEYRAASVAGMHALEIYRRHGEHVMEARVHNHLGRVSYLLRDYREAADHYTESLALATSFNTSTMVMINYADLADLRMAERRLEEAKRYALLAFNTMEHVGNFHMRGTTYSVVGRVTHAEARLASGAQQRDLLEQALSWFEKAREQLHTTQAYDSLADVYDMSAQILEELERIEEAIDYWRNGYEMLSYPDKESTKRALFLLSTVPA